MTNREKCAEKIWGHFTTALKVDEKFQCANCGAMFVITKKPIKNFAGSGYKRLIILEVDE